MVFHFIFHQVTLRCVESFPAPRGDHSCWMWILFMINVEFFPVDKLLDDQNLISVEGFPVDNLLSTPQHLQQGNRSPAI